ncbi:MAG TPA: TlpA disulfide reductase family protein [Pyrinomonadaceae bacterium]|nr:TlpA disulfide reductase family protein [Pyrinomonadaceae bacterium]
MGEVPLLKEIYARYRDKGLTLLGISLDDDPKPLQNMVKEKGIDWPQIRDGSDGSIVRSFNVKGTPTYYLLDREGRIAVKNISIEKLGSAIDELLK